MIRLWAAGTTCLSVLRLSALSRFGKKWPQSRGEAEVMRSPGQLSLGPFLSLLHERGGLVCGQQFLMPYRCVNS